MKKKKKLEKQIKTNLDKEKQYGDLIAPVDKINQIKRLVKVKNDIDEYIIREPVIHEKELTEYNTLVRKIKETFANLKKQLDDVQKTSSKRKSSALDEYETIARTVNELEHKPAKKHITAANFHKEDTAGVKTKRRRRRFKPKKIANQTIKQVKRISKRLKNKLIEKGRKTIKRFKKAKPETKKTRSKKINMYYNNTKPVKKIKNVRKFMKTLRPILFVKRLQNKATTRKNKNKDKQKTKNSKS